MNSVPGIVIAAEAGIPSVVIPAKAGIHSGWPRDRASPVEDMGPRLRGDDEEIALVSRVPDDDIYSSISGHGHRARDRPSAVLSFFANLR